MGYRKPQHINNQFYLDPEITFLNHGSFGACPKLVLEEYQRWQVELEKRPIKFMEDRVLDLLRESRLKLAEFVGCERDDLVYFPNPTTAINTVLRNLDLKAGDEILTTNHEYEAMNRTWKYFCHRTGAKYIQQPIALPLESKDDFLRQFKAGITERTKILFISHITSPTALIFPVAEICEFAKEKHIMTVIDGAHVPGHIPLNIKDIDPDIYTGACYKWLCAPKGSSFLYVRKSLQKSIEPLVISWGWESENPGPSQFVDWHEWQGTRDLSTFLSVPAAILFQKENNWQKVQSDCFELACETRKRINKLTDQKSICPDSSEWFGQMCSIRLPVQKPVELKKKLYEQFGIEIPIIEWNGEIFLRVSYQVYNDEQDLDKLLKALIACDI